MSRNLKHSTGGTVPNSEDVFSEAGKKCRSCAGKWVAFGRFVEERKCPFCGDEEGAVIIRGPSRVTPVTQQVETDGRPPLTIIAAGKVKKRRGAA